MEEGLLVVAELTSRLELIPNTYHIDIDAKWKLIKITYISQVDPTYEPALRKRAASLNNGERFYVWPKEQYSKVHTDKSCNADFCRY